MPQMMKRAIPSSREEIGSKCGSGEALPLHPDHEEHVLDDFLGHRLGPNVPVHHLAERGVKLPKHLLEIGEVHGIRETMGH